MAKIPGGLIVDMLSDGTVRLVFLASIGSGNTSPVTVKDLDEAEALFLTCGLTPERAAALRDTVKRNRFVRVDMSVDEEIAAKFQDAKSD